MARILAIDYGTKRTGIAVTDPLQIMANGLETVPTAQLLDFLNRYVEKEDVETIVVGYPTKTNGEDSENAKHVKPFVKRITKKFPQIHITLVDERFTSQIAQQTILQGGVKKKKRQDKTLVDKISATIILQSYLESLAYTQHKKIEKNDFTNL